jgi:hypothetical protein
MAVPPLHGGVAWNVFRASRAMLEFGSRGGVFSMSARVGRAAHRGFRQWIVVVGA